MWRVVAVEVVQHPDVQSRVIQFGRRLAINPNQLAFPLRKVLGRCRVPCVQPGVPEEFLRVQLFENDVGLEVAAAAVREFLVCLPCVSGICPVDEFDVVFHCFEICPADAVMPQFYISRACMSWKSARDSTEFLRPLGKTTRYASVIDQECSYGNGLSTIDETKSNGIIWHRPGKADLADMNGVNRMSSDCDIVAQWLSEARSAVTFTGAGISTESGIPDFRSPGGVWSRTQPVYYDDFLNSADSRLEYWRQKSESHVDFSDASPNIAHQALARWEAGRQMRGIITQNIDGLHQIAGSQSVLELHGTAREIGCLDCNSRFDADLMVTQFNETGEVPVCPHCSGLLKHATISFGQSLDETVLREAIGWCRDADLFLAMGSSLVVQPAAGLPTLARESGARLVIINREPTPLDHIADMVLHAGIGETIAAIEKAMIGAS